MEPDEVLQHISAGMVDDDAFEREMVYARKAHQHLWASVVPFKISEAALDAMVAGEPLLLDRENMLSMPLVGCLVCEQPFTSALRRRRCKGDPE